MYTSAYIILDLLPPGLGSTMNMNLGQYPQAESSSQAARSHVQYHLPYFMPSEIEHLSEKQRGKLSLSQEEKARQQACAFIDSVGAKTGL